MTDNLVNLVINSYKEINFVQKADKIFRFTDLNNRLTAFEKERILSCFKNLGYVFKMKSTKEFVNKQSIGMVEFTMSFNVNNGVILPYLYVYSNGERVPYDYPSFVFTYKYLKGDFETSMEPATVYTNYEEFEIIVKEVIDVYMEFRNVFLAKLNH